MIKIVHFYFEFFIYIFLKFEPPIPKVHYLTLNPKSILVNHKVKIFLTIR